MGYQERVNEKTPHGGEYMIAYYYDDNFKPADIKKATIIKIVEYDKKDNPVFETLGKTDNSK